MDVVLLCVMYKASSSEQYKKKKIVKAITITLYAYTGNTLNRNMVDGQDIFFTCFNMWVKVGFP